MFGVPSTKVLTIVNNDLKIMMCILFSVSVCVWCCGMSVGNSHKNTTTYTRFAQLSEYQFLNVVG